MAALAGAVVGAMVSATPYLLCGLLGPLGVAVRIALTISDLVDDNLEPSWAEKAAQATEDFLNDCFDASDGTIAIGNPTVLVNGKPIATTLIPNAIACNNHALQMIAEGSESAFVADKNIARKGDKTTCGAIIQNGSPNVFIGSGKAQLAKIADEFSFVEKAILVAVDMGFPPSRKGLKNGLGKIRLGHNTISTALSNFSNKVSKKNYKTSPKIKPVKDKLSPGSPEHKAKRWQDYKNKRSNTQKWSYDRWSKQYDTNMKNSKYGLEREKLYRERLGGKSETLKTQVTYRQIDISKGRYLGQLKTGKISLTKQAKLDIRKDSLLQKEGYSVEYILEKGASKPFLKALEKNKIKYTIGAKL
ncbi:PAAR domain-containing protein [Pasteurella sp. PK-2025]|uniref:PAAR domain-containing protein n=1 Tax=Pasteurella sp. PK-2025 TaxID=3413133 RepID=UPI003C74B8E0